MHFSVSARRFAACQHAPAFGFRFSARYALTGFACQHASACGLACQHFSFLPFGSCPLTFFETAGVELCRALRSDEPHHTAD
jgi:hypothetical protein